MVGSIIAKVGEGEKGGGGEEGKRTVMCYSQNGDVN